MGDRRLVDAMQVASAWDGVDEVGDVRGDGSRGAVVDHNVKLAFLEVLESRCRRVGKECAMGVRDDGGSGSAESTRWTGDEEVLTALDATERRNGIGHDLVDGCPSSRNVGPLGGRFESGRRKNRTRQTTSKEEQRVTKGPTAGGIQADGRKDQEAFVVRERGAWGMGRQAEWSGSNMREGGSAIR